MRLLLFTILLFFVSVSNAQPTDSLSRSIDSFSQAKDSFDRDMAKRIKDNRDSLERQEMQRYLQQNSKNLDRFLADMKEREEKEKRQMYVRLGLGGAFLVVLVIGLLRRRKKAREEGATK